MALLEICCYSVECAVTKAGSIIEIVLPGEPKR